MPLAESTYRGDADYCIDTTGDVVCGDQVRFERATFTGSFRNAAFAGFEQVTGTVVADSYGADRQQHTFTLQLEGGSRLKIKGRNLYRNGVWRKPWADPGKRAVVADEKHGRGATARAARAARKGRGNGE